MCSLEDGDIQPLRQESSQSLLGKKCVKCDQPGVLITRIHDSFCKSCFQVYVIHKFRASIGKSKLIREGEQVLLAISGGTNSTALLHLVEDGLSDRAHRKLRFIPTLLHVDECGVLNIDNDTRQKLRRSIISLMHTSGFSSYIADLEQAIKIERKIVNVDACIPHKMLQSCLVQHVKGGCVPSLPSLSEQMQLKALINSLASPTGKEDFVRNLRNQLIVNVARQLGFNKVLTADCSTRLAIRTLTDVSQGRGSQIAQNSAFCDQRNGDISFVRPVRDLSAKELTMYNSLFGVNSVLIPSITTKTDLDGSIERLTETFVTGLQADFSSTITNIVRTSEKLEAPELRDSKRCVFCQSPLDTNVGKASALFAIEFLQNVSRTARHQRSVKAETGDSSSDTWCPDIFHGKNSTNIIPSCCGLYTSLCYGCRVTLHNFNYTTSSLPSFITNTPITESKLSDKESFREKISDFLLDDATNID